jgi:hypothetical protein
MKQEESKESVSQPNNPWVLVIQKIHLNKYIELICLQALYPELFLSD